MNNQEKELIELQKDTVRLLSILVKRGALQSTLVQEFYEAGFSPKKIADILGTTPNSVSVAINRLKSKRKK